DLDEIVVAKGPGSYTGIRIGITTAKTMSWALNIPLYVVSSLEVLSYRAFLIGGYVCPIFDARRGLVFTGLYQRDNESMIEVKSDCNILFSDWLQEINEFIGSTETITFLSPELGAFKKEIIDIIGKRANFLPDIYNHSEASYLYQAKASKHLAETHTVTTNYLRLSEAEANWIRQQKR